MYRLLITLFAIQSSLTLGDPASEPVTMYVFSEKTLADVESSSQFEHLLDDRTTTEDILKSGTINTKSVMRPEVILGDRVPREDERAILWFKDEHQCTATQIGPRVILTSAHCFKYKVPNDNFHPVNEVVLRTYESNDSGESYTLQCAVNRNYIPSGPNTNKFPDWSLCLIKERERILPKYKRIHLDVFQQDTGELYGFGCRTYDEGEQFSNTLAKGTSKFHQPLPGRDNKFMFMSGTLQWACRGDSGGPVVTSIDSGSENAVVGVISHNERTSRVSLAAGLSSRAFEKFLRSWQAQIGFKPTICGIDANDCS